MMRQHRRARQAKKTELPTHTIHEELEMEQQISSPYLPAAEISKYELEIPGSGKELLAVSHEVIRAEIDLRRSFVSIRKKELDIAEQAMKAQVINSNKHHNNFRWSLFVSAFLALFSISAAVFLAMYVQSTPPSTLTVAS